MPVFSLATPLFETVIGANKRDACLSKYDARHKQCTCVRSIWCAKNAASRANKSESSALLLISKNGALSGTSSSIGAC